MKSKRWIFPSVQITTLSLIQPYRTCVYRHPMNYYKHPFRLLIPKISTGAYSTVLQEHHHGIQPPPFSPSRLKQEQYNTDVNYGTGNVDCADTTSPFYNNLAQYPNEGQSYGIDKPDTRFSTSPNSVPSSQFQKRLSGQSSTLPRASMGSGPDSVVSEKHFPGSPPGAKTPPSLLAHQW